jgi:hypothetical protein
MNFNISRKKLSFDKFAISLECNFEELKHDIIAELKNKLIYMKNIRN